mmetsp:Transcript_23795/g.27584  ORF Transcript_23795/g.27584 Transcript_23795/m.27584 type:complete len:92 (+) Transcript_23795:2450-2725(+)
MLLDTHISHPSKFFVFLDTSHTLSFSFSPAPLVITPTTLFSFMISHSLFIYLFIFIFPSHFIPSFHTSSSAHTQKKTTPLSIFCPTFLFFK